MLRDEASSRKSLKIAGVGRVIRQCKLKARKSPAFRIRFAYVSTDYFLDFFLPSLFAPFPPPYFFSPVSTQLLLCSSFSFIPTFPLSSSSSEDSAFAIVRLFLPHSLLLVFPPGRLSDPTILTVGCRVRLAISQVCSSFFFVFFFFQDLQNPARERVNSASRPVVTSIAIHFRFLRVCHVLPKSAFPPPTNRLET